MCSKSRLLAGSLVCISLLRSVDCHGVRSQGHLPFLEDADETSTSSRSPFTLAQHIGFPQGAQPFHVHDHEHDHRHLEGDEVHPCGVVDPVRDTLPERQERAKKEKREDSNISDALSFFGRLIKWLRSLFQTIAADDTDEIAVPTYFHVIEAKGSNSPSDSQVQEAYEGLNAAFGGTPFKFELKGITRTKDKAWHGYEGYYTDDEKDMKTTLRQGGPETLNIYINKVNGVCGYTLLPEYYEDFPIWDGVVVNENCFGEGQGGTVTHEVGHWMGLIHTFANGCDEPGDFIPDTNPQASYTEGCPAGTKDTCPDDAGEDPYHNHMDYSSPDCRNEFSEGQDVRMRAEWDLYRA